SAGMVIAQAPCATTGDRDGDGICDDIDPCPDTFNPSPRDTDRDGVFDACDNCPTSPNADQKDTDGDGIGDACDTCKDDDDDGICDDEDNCPGIRDGALCDDGNPCTINDIIDFDCRCRGQILDTDGDGVCDAEDACPGEDDTRDYDQDNNPDGCDDDPACTTCGTISDGPVVICHIMSNGIGQSFEGDCSFVAKYFDNLGQLINSADHCGPCTCDEEGDADRDGDGICDRRDGCPDNPDLDEPGPCGCEIDDADGDGVCDADDVCPGSDDNLDADGDGVPDACDDALNYCLPAADPTMEWIQEISIDGATLSNSNERGYSLSPTPIEVALNDRIPIAVTPETIDDLCELSMAVYLDVNQNGSFADEGELVLEGRSASSIAGVITDLSLESDQTYRLRVILHYGRIIDPCQAGLSGEVEDYLINIVEADPCVSAIEIFDYEVGSGAGGLAGGTGWAGPWEVELGNGAQVAIVEGSLDDDTTQDNMIGWISTVGVTSSMSRSLVSTERFNELSFSYRRVSGSSSLDVEIGEVPFGVDAMDRFYLGGEVGPPLNLDVTYTIRVQRIVDASGDLIAEMLIDADGDESTLSASFGNHSDDRTAQKLTFRTTTGDEFIPLAQFIDDIQISCTTTANVSSVPAKESKFKHTANSLMSVEAGELILPTSSNGAKAQLIDSSGRVLWTGRLSNDSQRLDLSRQSSGIYFLKYQEGAEVKVESIVHIPR
ncbi:MAG: GEVED domain-containing protein, partial [Bacteroidota bacterium]